MSCCTSASSQLRGGPRSTWIRCALVIGVGLGWPAGGSAADADRFHAAVNDLGADHDRSLAAVRTLERGGGQAAAAVSKAWPSLSSLGQKRAIEVLRRLAPRHREAVRGLVQAARSPDAEIQAEALTALSESGPAGHAGLAKLVSEPGVGDQAAILLARADPDVAMPVLLSAFDGPSGAARPALRQALGTSFRRAHRQASAVVSDWLRSNPSSGAAASAAVGLAGVASAGELQTRLVEHAIEGAGAFEVNWWILEAARTAGDSESIDRFARSELANADAWMLRASAIDSLAARGEREAARTALADPYPRVRMHAARALGGDDASVTRRAAMARRDVWPMVRAAATSSLRADPVALPVIVAAVDDPMSEVRAAAIRSLIDMDETDAWDRVHARLRDSDEWPPVVDAAIDYAVARCRGDATEALFGVVRRAASPTPLTEDLNSAARAVEALRVLDTPEANMIVTQLAETAEVPRTLQMAVEAPLDTPAQCPSLAP
ncbi:MAG: hypothetical protein AAF500_11215 [Myxococcota bacterium]